MRPRSSWSTFDLEALIPVVEGRTPLLIRVSRAADIRQALALAREENVHVILEDAQEAWLVADEIAAAKVPAGCVCNPAHRYMRTA